MAKRGIACAGHKATCVLGRPAGRPSIRGRTLALDTLAFAVQDVGVDHRRTDVAVAKQFLDGAQVLAVFKKVRLANEWRKLAPVLP